jgi:hypothetical protein
MPVKTKPKLAPADRLKREIQAVLTDEHQRGKRRPFRYTPAGLSRRARSIGFLGVIATVLARG